MSESVMNIGISQIRRMIPEGKAIELGDDFFIMETSYQEDLKVLKYPCRSDAYIAIFCDKGSFDVDINLGHYTISQNTFFVSTPGNIIKFQEPDKTKIRDIKVFIMAISKEFISTLSFDLKKVFDERLTLLTDPCIHLSEENLAICNQYLVLFRSLMATPFPNRKEAVGAAITSLFYSIIGLTEKSEENRLDNPLLSSSASVRMKLLFKHFMDLVNEYHSTQRNMAFYAGRLGLTPKYLSKLIKDITGRSAPEWIDSYVILEAKNMLKYTDVSIKEMVYKLHFPNPSVFYKFFKAHVGMTPNEYRNS